VRKRLRQKYSDAELAGIYQAPHQHNRWEDHILRVKMTIALASYFTNVKTVADLSAGDATIINAVQAETRYIGDFAPSYEFVGPIEKTIHEIPEVDLFICSETIEHLDNPDEVLAIIGKKAKHLILSTPDGETDHGNPEHYWGWDSEGVRQMLLAAGFIPRAFANFRVVDLGYMYQAWACDSGPIPEPAPLVAEPVAPPLNTKEQAWGKNHRNRG
jgi:hypothetical protein